VEFVDNNIQAKKTEENNADIIKINLQLCVDTAKNAENNKIKENQEEKESKDKNGKELIIKYCPTNATLADLITKPLKKANIRKICKMIRSIIGQQEGVGENNSKVPVPYGTYTATGTGIGSSSGTGTAGVNNKLVK
jgi:hypothetical protein